MVKVLEYFHYEIARFIITYENFRRLKGNRILESQSSSNTARSFSLDVLQASTASNKTTAPPRLVETGPSVYRWRTATSARVHPALRARIARTTSTNATGTRADTAPARTFTDRTSKSKNDIVNALSLSLSLSALHIFFRRKLRSHAPIKRRGRRRNRN